MKNKFGIGLFTFSIVAVYLLANKNNQTQMHELEQTYVEESISTDGPVVRENYYYLYDVNGYIVVYLGDQKTPYEYTEILIDDLPELLKQEIRNGKYIKNTEELYGFLENYSS